MLALVGESGCGKSTLALTLMGLEPMTTGSVKIAGDEIGTMKGKDMRTLRQHIQMIFQDPYESLNPIDEDRRYRGRAVEGSWHGQG